jgi:hypothetical protein
MTPGDSWDESSQEVLMLWNPLMLQQETFGAIVDRFRPNVDGFVLEDCYNSQEVPDEAW